MKTLGVIFLTVFVVLGGSVVFGSDEQTGAVSGKRHEIKLLAGEKWWGGFTVDGGRMPFGGSDLKRDLYGENRGNQAQPLLISSAGRYVWSEGPFAYQFKDGVLKLESKVDELVIGSSGTTLREVYRYVSKVYFPSDGKIPPAMFFTRPQYNTWIELMYDQREERIRRYARDIIDNGFPAGVFMIDANWQEDYGKWDFHPGRFSDPKGMIEMLHGLGFKVMLWVCPYVSPDSDVYRALAKEKLLLMAGPKRSYITRWWDGYSAVPDFTNPGAVAWFKEQLDRLCQTYGVDGFKFDGADTDHYTQGPCLSAEPVTPNRHTELWAQLGLAYPYNEYRACWKCAGLPLVQRLRDKRHRWDDLQKLMPDAMAASLMGYAYVCPDLIGGGEFKSFLGPDARIDQELIVRYAQCSALMPMMQFSVSPWRVLDAKNRDICLAMAKLHVQMGDSILELARHSAKTGEPIVRHMEYVFPHQGYAEIKDQFMLGDNILVAPVVEKDKTTRRIVFPAGEWMGDDGSTVTGPCELDVSTPIERLPWYRRKL